MQLFDQIQECLAFIRKRTDFKPQYGIILGTGLSGLAKEIEVVKEFNYGLLPFFPTSTVASHAGRLVFGHLNGVAVVAMAGRFHHYEGYSMQQLTFPVRVLKALGIERLIISNASGSVNEKMNAGDVVFLRDHINLQPANPLRGQNDERLGPRFPDMLHTYDTALNEQAMAIGEKHGLSTHQGVYLAISGPNLETPAEYKMANILGADLIGMSTVPEVLVARHMDLPVLVLSVVSNKCWPLDQIQPTSLEDVVQMVQSVEPKLVGFMKELVVELAK